MNADLTGDFTTMEVEVALKQMAPLKAPEPMVSSLILSKLLDFTW